MGGTQRSGGIGERPEPRLIDGIAPSGAPQQATMPVRYFPSCELLERRLLLSASAAARPPQQFDLALIDAALPDHAAIVSAWQGSVLVYDGRSESAAAVLDRAAAVVRRAAEASTQPLRRSIALFAHGTAGGFQVGRSLVTDPADPAAGDWRAVGRALGPGGSIRLYGCDVAASMDGRQLVAALDRQAGVAVYASTDLTGAGGDWDLEYASRGADAATPAPLDAAALAQYSGTLAPNQIPSFATAPSATPNIVTTTSTSLSTLGADDGGEANLIYIWDAQGLPGGASQPTYSVNGTHAAKNTAVTFSRAGAYSMRVILQDAQCAQWEGYCDVTVLQTLTSIVVSPASPTVGNSGTVRLTAVGYDQFGQPMASFTPTWAVTGGGAGGSVDSNGIYTAPASGTGTTTVTATSGSITGSATVTVAAAPSNTAPVNVVPSGTVYTKQDVAVQFSTARGTRVAVTDANSASLTVTLSVTNGTLTLAGTSGLTFTTGTGTGNTTMSFSGTVAAINTALEGMSFTPTNGHIGAASLQITSSDGSLSDTDTVTLNVAHVVVVQAESYNAGSATGAGFTTLTDAAALNGYAITTNATNIAGAPPAETVTYTVTFPNAGATNTYHLYMRYRLASPVLSDDSGYVSSALDNSATLAGSWDLINNLANHGGSFYTWIDLSRTISDVDTAVAYTNVTAGAHTFRIGGREDGLIIDALVFATAIDADTTTHGQTLLTEVASPPSISTTGGSLAYTENAAATAIDSALTVTPGGGATLAGATVQITSNYASGQDVLAFTNQNGITGSWNATTGAMTLTGTATVAQYQAALRSVTYANSSENPSTATRTVSFAVTDGSLSSTAVTRNVSVTAVNDTPVNTVPGSQSVASADLLVFQSANANAISVSDVDIGSNDIRVTLSVSSGKLTLKQTTGLTFTVGTGTANTTMTFSGTIANVNAALAGMSYRAPLGYAGTDTLTITSNDLGSTGTGGAQSKTDTVTITVADVTANLIHHFTLDEGTGTKAYDMGSAGQNGTFVGNPTWNSSGKLGSGVDNVFGGAISYTQAAAGTITVAAWVRPTGLGGAGFGRVLSSPGFDLWTQSTNTIAIQWKCSGTNGYWIAPNNSVPLDGTTWTHVAFTYNPSTPTTAPQIYINGQSVAVTTFTAPVGTATAAAGAGYIGNNSSLARQFSGRLDDIRVYDKQMTAAEIAAVYNVGISGDAAPTTTADAYGVVEDTPISVAAASGVLANDSDSQGRPLSAVLISNVSRGTLTLNADGSFSYTPNANWDTTDSFTYAAYNGVQYGPTRTVTFNFTPVNDAPTLASIEGTTLADTEKNPPTVITSSIVVADVDNTSLASATVTISANYVNGEDTLSFTNANGITGSWNAATGTLTLSGSATLAHYQTALRSVRYSNGSSNPSTATRTVSFSVSDGGLSSNAVTRNISVTAVNDAPTLTSIEGTSLVYIENAAATAITSTLVVADVDNTSLSGATVSITGDYASGEDVLAFTNQNGITGVWNSVSGVLTLSGTATVAQYQAALRSVTYANSSDSPSTLTRTVSFTVNDGSASSNTATRGIAVTAVNDAPTLTGIEGTALAYTENAAATAITSTLVVADADNTNLTGATVQITGNYQSGQDVLAFANQNGIAGSWNSATGTMTLSGTATIAQYQAGLRSVSYSNSSDSPSTVTRTVSFSAADGALTSNVATRTISITAVNDAPVAADDAYTLAEDGTLAVASVPAISNPSFDSNLTGWTTSGPAARTTSDSHSGAGSVRMGYGGGSAAYLSRVVSGLTPSTTYVLKAWGKSANPADLVVFGVSNHGAAQVTTDVTSSAWAEYTVTFTTGAASTSATIWSWAWVVNTGYGWVDDFSLTPQTSSLLNDTDEGMATAASFLIVTNPTNGVLTSNTNGSFTYTPNANYNGSDSFTYKINDGAADSNVATVNLTVTAANDAPTLASIEGTALAYTENAAATAVTTTLVVADVDSANLAGATVQITGNYQSSQDVLAFANQNGITGSWNSATGTMTLSGTATVAQYQAALRSITYANTSDDPSTATRTVSFTVNDGAASSTATTRNVSVTAVNDAPTVATAAAATPSPVTGVTTALSVLGTDLDHAESALTYTWSVTSQPAGSSPVFSANGTNAAKSSTVTFDRGGEYTFQVTISDGTASTTSSVSVVVDPALWYKLDGTLNNAALGNSNPGTAVNGPVLTTTGGRDGGALSLDGVNDYVNVGTYDIGDNFTIAGWVYLPNVADTAVIMANGQGGAQSNGFRFAVNGWTTNDRRLIFETGNGVNGRTTSTASAVIPVNDWAHVAAVVNRTSGTLRLYVDGVDVTPTGNWVLNDFQTNAPIWIGSYVNGGGNFQGQLDDLRVYNRQLAAAEVAAIALAGPTAPASLAASVTGATTTQLAWTDASGETGYEIERGTDGVNWTLIATTAADAVSYDDSGLTHGGTYHYRVRATDGAFDSLYSNSVTVVVNRAPVGVADAYSTNEDTALVRSAAAGVLANDTDADADTLTADLVSNVTNGTLSLNADGSFTYAPAANYVGSDSFTYRTFDGTAYGSATTVTLTVT
ncbi:MAG TPA: tandem-95 repeat protein, partial [Tepidisphaeraceae bacterium]|nr:tandem-95 repeat protein [Tepidisphaeraceae bacterium]